MHKIIVYKRNKIYKELKNTNDLLVYLNNSSKTKFVKINKSLISYLNNIKLKNITKTKFDDIIKKYQTAVSNRSVLFWTRRGYSEEEAKQQISHLQNNSKHINYKTRLIPNQKEYWIKKGYSEEKSIKKVIALQKENSPRCKEYWIKKGFSAEDSTKKVKIHQNNSKYIDYNKRLLPSNIDFWIKKGYSEIEAKEMLSERQRTFSLEKCIKKYGLEKGQEVFNQRQIKWQETLNSKPQEEIDRINKLKGTNSIGYYSKGKFIIHPYLHKKQGVLYYFECKIDGNTYWKIGITTRNFNQRFNKTFQKKYNVTNIKLHKNTIYNCYNKEQQILHDYKLFRVCTKLGTEYFNTNINTIKESII